MYVCFVHPIHHLRPFPLSFRKSSTKPGVTQHALLPAPPLVAPGTRMYGPCIAFFMARRLHSPFSPFFARQVAWIRITRLRFIRFHVSRLKKRSWMKRVPKSNRTSLAIQSKQRTGSFRSLLSLSLAGWSDKICWFPFRSAVPY